MVHNVTMKSLSTPNSLQVPRHSGGTLIAVGLPWDSGIFVQEYWRKGIPYYAIVNVSDDVAEVGVSGWTGVVGGRLTGSWSLQPGTVQNYAVQDLMTYRGPLVAVSLNEKPVWGLLKTPRLPTDGVDWNKLTTILTIYGLNGVGDRDANLHCFQEHALFASGEAIWLALQVPEDISSIVFGEEIATSHLPPAVVVEIRSETLSVKEQGGRHIVVAQEDSAGTRRHEIRLYMKLPEVESEMMTTFGGRVSCTSGAGYSFARGLIVGPRGGGYRTGSLNAI